MKWAVLLKRTANDVYQPWEVAYFGPEVGAACDARIAAYGKINVCRILTVRFDRSGKDCPSHYRGHLFPTGADSPYFPYEQFATSGADAAELCYLVANLSREVTGPGEDSPGPAWLLRRG